MPVRRRRARLLRRVLGRPLHARGARRCARRADRRLAAGHGRPGLHRRLREDLPGVRRHAEPAVPRRAALGGGRCPGAAQARGPQPHRRAQGAQRARPGPADEADGQDAGSSPRPAPASTASPAPPRRPTSTSTAPSTWAPSTPAARRSTSRGCSSSAPRSSPSTPAARPSRTRSTRRCATGSPASTTPPTSSARQPDRTRSRAWSATSPAASATRREPSASSSTARCRTPSPRASAAGPTRSACSPPSSRTSRWRSTASSRAETASTPGGTPPRSTPASAGVLHGARTYVLQDEDGQTIESHSISAGLDYPGVGPAARHLAATGRATYLPVTDAEAMDALALLSRTEGIIPAIESAHASPAGWRSRATGRGAGPGRDHDGQPVRSRRQGHGHGDRVVRSGRRGRVDRTGTTK